MGKKSALGQIVSRHLIMTGQFFAPPVQSFSFWSVAQKSNPKFYICFSRFPPLPASPITQKRRPVAFPDGVLRNVIGLFYFLGLAKP